jgi:hypothetical protein
MRVLRKVIMSSGEILTIDLPKGYQKCLLEIIVQPLVESELNTKKNKLLKKAHATIDTGCSGFTYSLIESFEDSLRDREIPRF